MYDILIIISGLAGIVGSIWMTVKIQRARRAGKVKVVGQTRIDK